MNGERWDDTAELAKGLRPPEPEQRPPNEAKPMTLRPEGRALKQFLDAQRPDWAK